MLCIVVYVRYAARSFQTIQFARIKNESISNIILSVSSDDRKNLKEKTLLTKHAKTCTLEIRI